MKTEIKPDFEAFFHAIPGLNLVLSPDLKINEVNEAYLHATHTQRETVIDRYLFDVFPDNPANTEASGVCNLDASLQYVLREKKAHEMPVQRYDVRRPDGSFEERYWKPLNTPVFDKAGTLSFIIHNVQDVTETKKNTNRLTATEQTFRVLVKNVKDYAIFLLDRDGKVASWNDGAQHIKGYSEEGIIGTSLEIFYTQDDKEKNIPFTNLRHALASGRYETQGWRVRKDGTMFYADIVFTAIFDEAGNHTGFSKVTRDISEKRAQEEQLRFLASIASNIHDPVICSTNDFVITSWNTAAEQLLGWKSHEVIGKTTTEVMRTSFPREARSFILAVLRKNGYWQGEVIYHTKIGLPLNVLCTASVLRDQEGKATGILFIVKDITARKKAERELSMLNINLERLIEERTQQITKSEKKYRLLFEHNPLPLWVIELTTFKFLDVNEMALLKYGYSREEFLNLTAIDIRPAEDRAAFLQSNHSYKSADHNKGIWRHQKKDGSIITVEIIGHEILFEGLPARLVLVNDVTERKRAEQRVIQSEENLKAIFDNASEGFVLTDTRGIIKTFNAKVGETILPYPAAYFAAGKSIFDFVEANRKEDYAEIYRRVLEGETVEYDRLYAYEDGNNVWVNFVLNPVKKDGQVTGVCITGRDISAAMLAEKQKIFDHNNLAALINNTHDMIWSVDRKFHLITSNIAFNNTIQAITGSIPRQGDDMLNIPASKDQLKRYKEYYSRAFAGETFTEVEHNKAAKKSWSEISFNPIYEGENVVGTACFSRDITERVLSKKEEQKKITLAILQGQEKERHHIGRELHDNINQILAATRMFLFNASTKNELVREATRYPLELLDNSIDEVRSLCHKMVTPLSNINLNELVSDLLLKLEQGTDITTTLLYNVPEGILCDELKINIYRILQEVTSNIIKYAAATKVGISITVKDDLLRVYATDNGKGFDVSATREGIGISNMINRVQPFNGELHIKSSEGNGCDIVINIPVEAAMV